MFIDTATLELKAGKGGDGCVAFRREKFEPSGGPYGGDGGDGGSIIFLASTDIRTLMDFRYKTHYKAESGENGRTKRQFGKKGEDLVLKVPVGTLIKDAETGAVIKDLTEAGQAFVCVKGGKGGRGNAKFANPVRQAPRFAEPGTQGQARSVLLEIKLLADVGFVGLPNVGKSSLLSILSAAKPKIANYHFTTLEPNLGVVQIGPEQSFVIADIPGLIEGASEGIGLGHDFLKHVERTRLLVHVLDVAGSEARDPLEDFRQINEELEKYNPLLMERPQIICANKMDLDGAEEGLARLQEALGDQYAIYPVSAATTEGVKELRYAMWEALEKLPVSETFDLVEVEEALEPESIPTEIRKEEDGFYITGDAIMDLVGRVNFEDYDSLNYFQKRLNQLGINDQLLEMGIEDGDTVHIGDLEFDYYH